MTKLSRLLSLLAPLGLAVAGLSIAGGPDSDGDGIVDSQDNCLLIPNALQTDSDQDGHGNPCDADYTQDGIVGGPDYAVFVVAWGSREGDPNFDPRADCNDDGVIGGPDFTCYHPQYQQPGFPGPSGLACAEPAGTPEAGGPCP